MKCIRGDKMCLQKFCLKLLAIVILLPISLTTSCQKREVLPQPNFPLSEEDITAAVEAQELNWILDQDHPNEATSASTVYGLIRPEVTTDFSTVFVTSVQSDKIGRYLSTILMISRKQLQWPLDEPHSWDEWKELFQLSAQLYGGFEDDEAIYRACMSKELPMEETLLWDGALIGGYCRVRTSTPIQDWSPYIGGGLTFYIYVDVFETEDAYCVFAQENT